MQSNNVTRVLEMLKPNDVVLDIGGWASPFNRANYVMDFMPYDTRGYYAQAGGQGSLGGGKEQFTKKTWIQRDICAKEPFPFKDNEIDFVICSHTLEDVRDPLWVCQEINRIAKAGYIEVPSKILECSRGAETPLMPGYSHHRWVVDLKDNHFEFMMKYHMLHQLLSLSFPVSFCNSLTEDERNTYLFWEGSFEFSEKSIHGLTEIKEELSNYVQSIHPYSERFIKWDRRLAVLSMWFRSWNRKAQKRIPASPKQSGQVESPKQFRKAG